MMTNLIAFVVGAILVLLFVVFVRKIKSSQRRVCAVVVPQGDVPTVLDLCRMYQEMGLLEEMTPFPDHRVYKIKQEEDRDLLPNALVLRMSQWGVIRVPV